MEDLIRIGKISTVNYAAGTASVVFTDRNNEASANFPFFSMAYEMPKVNDTVVVIMLQNSTTKGFILGVPFSGKKIPAESGQGIFCKEFQDGTSILYDPKTKTMDISTSKITLKSVTAESVTVKGALKAKTIKAAEITADNLEVTDTAKIKNLEVSEMAKINNLELSGTATGHFPS